MSMQRTHTKKNEKEKESIYEILTGLKLKKDLLERLQDELKNQDKPLTNHVLTDGMENLVNMGKLRGLTKTQMRTLYEEVKTGKENIIKLRVKLIYIAGKLENKDAKDFITLVIDIIKVDFALGKDFMESALAYHKFNER